ncbi:MAG: agglutinin biogenesis protein MshI [Gammaproteobacteria bacterium]|nr:agglutinin biogenesis protein MshI [Gammaproteobacteria bacterium]
MWQRLINLAANGKRAGLSMDDARLAAASVHCRDDGKPEIATVTVDRSAGSNAWAELLDSDVGRQAHKLPVTSALPDGSYQLLLVEVPDVPEEEVASAIPWKIKDLLDSPVEDNVIEIFDMPGPNPGRGTRMAYAVAARRFAVADYVGQMRKAGISLDVISIPELCLRNIATRLPQDRDGVAFLHLTEDHAILTISRQGLLYLIRRIERGNRLLRDADSELARNEAQATFVLEVQRSLDYYESHFDRRPLSQLVLAPGSDAGGLANALSDQLGLSVSNLDLSQIFDMQTSATPEEQGACLLAIGAGLRTADVAAQGDR